MSVLLREENTTYDLRNVGCRGNRRKKDSASIKGVDIVPVIDVAVADTEEKVAVEPVLGVQTRR
jgi:hypothetical protein